MPVENFNKLPSNLSDRFLTISRNIQSARLFFKNRGLKRKTYAGHMDNFEFKGGPQLILNNNEIKHIH